MWGIFKKELQRENRGNTNMNQEEFPRIDKSYKDCVLKRKEENLNQSQVEKKLEIKGKEVNNSEKESTLLLKGISLTLMGL
jgi:hypothetical protein